jgi:RNA polymerase sigma-70 factor (ECF subfamily)
MTDFDIIQLYFERSERAIEETERAYGKYCRYIANEILRNIEDSEEVVNDTYLKTWESIPPQNPSSLKLFLGKITRFLSINRLEHRNAQKRGGGQLDLVLDELYGVVPSGEGGVVDEIALKDAINVFLRSLSAEKRRIFIRRYWYMSPISEIADDFSVSEGKVKMILSRTRKELKKTLEKEGIIV